MYEHRSAPLAPRRTFFRRLARNGALAIALVMGSLGFGTVGFHGLAEEPWLDAFLNAAMLLGGMGPVGTFDRPAGKVFAAVYALYAGLIFLVAAGVFFAPVLHRFLHRLHVSERDSRGG